MRKLIAVTLAAALLLTATACGVGVAAPQTSVTLWQASDLHYLSPALVEDDATLLQLAARSDGKVTHLTPYLTEAFVAEAVAAHPDAVILSGDLTLNGAPQSHRDLAELLQPLRDAGIPVLVLPGNHDTGSTAYRFTAEGAEETEGTAAEAFALIYAGLDAGSIIARDERTLSCMAELPGEVRVLLVDVNAGHTAGTVPEETLLWIEEQLQAAQKAGATVIAVSHQSLLVHNPMFTFGYQINNASALEALYRKYGVTLNVSGHLHLQSIVQGEGITDIATSSLAVTPNQYGVITLSADRSSCTYVTQPVAVAAWAAAEGRTEESLLNFAQYSKDFFDGCTYYKVRVQLDALELTEAERAAMEDFALRVNREYFGGTLQNFSDDPAYALWEAHSEELRFARYFASILLGDFPENNRWSLQKSNK